jgi:hypothetical protein
VVNRGDPHRTAITEIPGINYAMKSPLQNEDGSFRGEWCLVLVEAKNHARFNNLPDVYPLPNLGGLDHKLNSIRTATVQGMENMLRARGFNVTWSQSDGFRDVVRSVGRQIDPAFNEVFFDVSE